MSVPQLLRIGARSSPMSLAQVERVRAELAARHPGIVTEVVPVTTSGDRWTGALSDLGGKGAFTKELDDGLLRGDWDLAVHCVKDVPGDRPVPAGTAFAAYLRRDDIRDALVQPAGLTLDELPVGARVGTSSVRRIAHLARYWPHIEPVPCRGNANTRLAKLDAGEYDALLLAVSGLERIGRTDRIAQVLDVERMMPAVGSGTLVLQCRADEPATIDALAAIGDPEAFRQTTAERMLLHVLQGHCNSPISAYAVTEPDGRLGLRARVFSLDGKVCLDAHEWDHNPLALGTSVAATLLRQGAHEVISGIPH
ncbi:hydroxymethylbilane synthase [Streptacidiphilus rugosus]|uniref:hydroxymethylbilane synthase n=1 Tax=Streptacidiphilus rugosus TaxID=405783 RepID=UPI000562B7F9|nr:hydroxymethylbilane synthase [Streptacidiphilus rugosus]